MFEHLDTEFSDEDEGEHKLHYKRQAGRDHLHLKVQLCKYKLEMIL